MPTHETDHHRFAFVTDEYCWLGVSAVAFRRDRKSLRNLEVDAGLI